MRLHTSHVGSTARECRNREECGTVEAAVVSSCSSALKKKDYETNLNHLRFHCPERERDRRGDMQHGASTRGLDCGKELQGKCAFRIQNSRWTKHAAPHIHTRPGGLHATEASELVAPTASVLLQSDKCHTFLFPSKHCSCSMRGLNKQGIDSWCTYGDA